MVGINGFIYTEKCKLTGCMSIAQKVCFQCTQAIHIQAINHGHAVRFINVVPSTLLCVLISQDLVHKERQKAISSPACEISAIIKQCIELRFQSIGRWLPNLNPRPIRMSFCVHLPHRSSPRSRGMRPAIRN